MSSEHNELFVIGIGSSAGGLESLCLLVSSLPVECPCAYIIAQHTSPSHRSMLADILSRDSKLEVRVLTDGEKIQKGKVFVIPPGKNAVIKDGYIRLTDTIPEVSPKPSINTLFESIAEQFREMGFGIILSGTGADGARGIRAIKASGGVAFVQSPESAKYDGMPRSAIEAVQVDCIIPPEKMGPAIGRFVGFPAELLLEPQTDRSPEMSILFDRVLSQTNIDFSSYKQSTVLRRLHRRIMATDSRDIKSYIDYIDAFPEELQLFAKEALISVTKFFRDKESFSTLRSCIDELVKSKEKGADFRVWVAGCATGEEAYSIAISFIESMRSRDDLGSLTVFATDIDTNALDVARRGIYSYAAVSELPSDLLNRYFRASETSYRPIKSLRDSITFSRQDMTCDPPFMRLDFVSCRNVLIYFNQSLQAQVLSIFRYALRENGVLFLGRSETVSQNEPCFDTLDRQHRIYRSIGDSRPNIITLPSRVRSRDRARSLKDGRDTHHNEFIQALLDTCQPSILIDSGLRIIHLHGHLSDFIDIKSRNTETILSKVITSEFTSELVTTVGRARRQNTLTYSRTRRIKSLDNQPFRMVVKPIEGRDRFLLSFEKVQKASETDKAYEDVAQNSAPDDEELKSVREQNLSLIQELATSSEQLQALNEEMQASNEELQATNEELEATNEELAATNEELISVNEEAMRKSVELSILNAEFESVFNIIEFPIIVFNDDMTVSRANESARHMYMLEARSIGSHVSDLSLPPYLAGINGRLQETFIESRKVIYDINRDDRSLKVYISPTHTVHGEPGRAVVVIVDNTEVAIANNIIKRSEKRLLSILNNSTSLVSLKDMSGRYEFVNEKFEKVYELESSIIIGKADSQLFDGKIAKSFRGADLDVIRAMKPLHTVEEVSLGGKSLWFDTTRFPVIDGTGITIATCTQANDITDKVLSEQRLARAERHIRTVTDLQSRFIKESSKTRVFEDTIQALVETTSSEYGFILMYDSDSETGPLETVAVASCTTNMDISNKLKAFAPDIGNENFKALSLNAIVNKAPFAHNSSESMPDFKYPLDGVLQPFSLLEYPVLSGKIVIGLIYLVNRPNGYDRNTIDSVEQLLSMSTQFLIALRGERVRHRSIHALKLAKDEAEHANASKTVFLANMSHELRTPLNAIIGFSELLYESEQNVDRKDYLRIVSAAGHDLLNSIQDVLDLTRVESGKAVSENTIFCIEDTVKTVASMFMHKVNKAKLSLDISISPKLPKMLRGDCGSLRQVLLNLVGNAIKFTSSGRIGITVLPGRNFSDDSHYTLLAHVTDTGVGIRSENLTKIFTMFEQEDSLSSLVRKRR